MLVHRGHDLAARSLRRRTPRRRPRRSASSVRASAWLLTTARPGASSPGPSAATQRIVGDEHGAARTARRATGAADQSSSTGRREALLRQAQGGRSHRAPGRACRSWPRARPAPPAPPGPRPPARPSASWPGSALPSTTNMSRVAAAGAISRKSSTRGFLSLRSTRRQTRRRPGHSSRAGPRRWPAR